MRLNFTQIFEEGKLEIDNKGRKLLMIRGKEIGLVYYRNGFLETQHQSENEWKAREMLELSMAIKCPSIDGHLMTFKKI